MNEIVVNVIAVVVTSVVIPLVTLLGAKLTQWINGRIKDDETKKVVEEINQIISTNVSYVFQTYVDNFSGFYIRLLNDIICMNMTIRTICLKIT